MKRKEFLTLQEAAKYLDVGERTLFRYLHEEKIKAAWIGRWRFRKEDLDGFIESSFRKKKRK